jgi:hypothetical protein
MVDDVLYAINVATNDMATRLHIFVDLVSQLQGDQTSQVRDLAEEMRPFVDRLRHIGADHDNPVPLLIEPLSSESSLETHSSESGQ